MSQVVNLAENLEDRAWSALRIASGDVDQMVKNAKELQIKVAALIISISGRHDAVGLYPLVSMEQSLREASLLLKCATERLEQALPMRHPSVDDWTRVTRPSEPDPGSA